MKRRIILMTAVLSASLLSAGLAQAEVRFNVPFDFSVGKVLLPSGTYTVTRVGAVQTFLQIRSLNTAQGALGQIHSVELNPDQVSEANALVFHRYGNQYFLAQFWTAGNSTGFELPRSKAEREVANTAKAKTEVLTAGKQAAALF